MALSPYGHGHRSPADHSILMLGSIGGLITLAAVVAAASITGSAPAWAALAPAGALLGALALLGWRRVRRDGYFHRVDDEDEDEDPQGGGTVRFPPDPSDDGGWPELDWNEFLVEFWGYVEARHHRQRETVSASSGPAGG